MGRTGRAPFPICLPRGKGKKTPDSVWFEIRCFTAGRLNIRTAPMVNGRIIGRLL